MNEKLKMIELRGGTCYWYNLKIYIYQKILPSTDYGFIYFTLYIYIKIKKHILN